MRPPFVVYVGFMHLVIISGVHPCEPVHRVGYFDRWECGQNAFAKRFKIWKIKYYYCDKRSKIK